MMTNKSLRLLFWSVFAVGAIGLMTACQSAAAAPAGTSAGKTMEEAAPVPPPTVAGSFQP